MNYLKIRHFRLAFHYLLVFVQINRHKKLEKLVVGWIIHDCIQIYLSILFIHEAKCCGSFITYSKRTAKPLLCVATKLKMKFLQSELFENR